MPGNFILFFSSTFEMIDTHFIFDTISICSCGFFPRHLKTDHAGVSTKYRVFTSTIIFFPFLIILVVIPFVMDTCSNIIENINNLFSCFSSRS